MPACRDHEEDRLPLARRGRRRDPDRLSEAVRSNRYLSMTERQRIDSMHRHGVGMREIARRLDRSPSTVSRELRRNTAGHDLGGYDAVLAHSRARARGARPGRTRLAKDSGLRAVVQGKLELEWSPEQISAHLRAAFPERPGWHVCHETIYQALHRGSRGGLSRKLTKRLRTGRPLRKRRRRPDERRTRYVVPHQRIQHRPAIVADRVRLGDWESQCCCQAARGWLGGGSR